MTTILAIASIVASCAGLTVIGLTLTPRRKDDPK